MVPYAGVSALAPSGSSLTNSPGQGALLASPQEQPPWLGIDTITVAGPIAGIAECRHYADVSVNPMTGEWTSTPVSAQVALACGTPLRMVRRSGRPLAVITQSIPRLLRGDNVVCSSLAEALTGVERLYSQAAEFVDWRVPVESLTVSRLDVDRDFRSVPAVPQFLTNLSRIPVPRGKASRLFSEPQRGSVQTISRGCRGRWQASLYDKHAQVLHLAASARDTHQQALLTDAACEAVGQVRYEASIRRPVLHDNGVNTLTDITDERLDSLARKHFRHAGFDVAAHAAGHLNEVLLAKAPTADAKTISGVLGYLASEALGYPWPGDARTRRKYAQIADEWTLSPADWRHQQGDGAALDFDLGVLS